MIPSGSEIVVKLLHILLVFFSFEMSAKTIFIVPPQGYSYFSNFKSKSEFELRAYDAVKTHLLQHQGRVSDYYLSSAYVNVASASYEFKVKHRSEFHDSMVYMPFLSGRFIYNVTTQSVTFISESQDK